MKELIVNVEGCPLTKQQLDAILGELNLSLPKELYDFYLLFKNAQSFRETFHDSGYNVRGWFCFKTAGCEQQLLNLSFQSNFVNSRYFLPPYLIPFASSEMSDYFLISINEEDYGSVLSFRTDMHFEETGALTLLNTSFLDFVNGLSVDVD